MKRPLLRMKRRRASGDGKRKEVEVIKQEKRSFLQFSISLE